MKLPSRSPLGTLRHTQPIFEDPSRVRGKRDYMAGDSLRRVDWKATASTGRLQVKQFEPSIALETAIFLNLNADEYAPRTRLDATELAIVIAASLANWIVGKRQSVGLSVNGVDPIGTEDKAQALPPRKGRAHLTRILDVLARVRSAPPTPFAQLFQYEAARLPWGTTVILITGRHRRGVVRRDLSRAPRRLERRVDSCAARCPTSPRFSIAPNTSAFRCSTLCVNAIWMCGADDPPLTSLPFRQNAGVGEGNTAQRDSVLTTLTNYLIVSGMLTCAAIGLVQVGQQVSPRWNASFVPVLCLLHRAGIRHHDALRALSANCPCPGMRCAPPKRWCCS